MVKEMSEESVGRHRKLLGLVDETSKDLRKLKNFKKNIPTNRELLTWMAGERILPPRHERRRHRKYHLTCVELFTGKAPLSKQVGEFKGTAKRYGTDWGRDLLLPGAQRQVRRDLCRGVRRLWCSPPCTPFSSWQHLRAKTDPEALQKKRALGWGKVRFVMEMMDLQ
eukprot:4361977-Alexandrium_andersonii.AAC.1